MKLRAQTPKGFRDFLPDEANIRKFVVDKITETFRSFGFEPLETPALEYQEVLLNKYGEEGDRLMYSFETMGGDLVALRYDQTVPLARVVAQYQDIPKPFKRYQIQNVWRGENTQKGRYREFLQCDADIVGADSPLADAELINLVLTIYKNLGLDVTIKINDRNNFAGLEAKFVSAIDKLEKIGEEGVLKELKEKGMDGNEAARFLNELQNKPLTGDLSQILDFLKDMGADMEKIKYDPTLARGLDYYTGMIFETIAEGSTGSICSGGRWDKMIGNFTGKDMPATGFGLGFDRTIEVLKEQKLLPDLTSSAKVLVTIFNPELSSNSVKIAQKLRDENINVELWVDENSKLDKQLKYADQKGIPYVIILGPEEAEKDKITLKDLENKSQETMSLDEATRKLTS